MTSALFSGLCDVQTLAMYAVLFVLTFVLYGSRAAGAGRDGAGCPRRAEPFAAGLSVAAADLLLAVAQAVGVGEEHLALLALLPPFTPFVLMLAKPGAIDGLHAAVGLVGMLALASACVSFGAQALRGEFKLRAAFSRAQVRTTITP